MSRTAGPAREDVRGTGHRCGRRAIHSPKRPTMGCDDTTQKKGARGGDMVSPTQLDAVSEGLRLRQRLEALQGVVLDLADALAGHAERPPHLLERARRLAEEPEAQLDHASLPVGERAERGLDVLAPERERGGVERR